MAAPTDTAPPAAVDPATPGRKRRRAGLAGVVVLAAAAVATVALTTGHHHPARPAYDSACGLTGGTVATPKTAPVTQWQNLNGWYLPVTTAYGPGTRSATGAWSCYAHTPTGAVLAAWTIPVRIESAKDFASVVRQQTVGGAGQQALLTQGQDHSSAMLPVPLGFRIDSYSKNAAAVTFHVRQAGAEAACAAGLRWQPGVSSDWVLDLQPNGDMYMSCVPWAAGGAEYIDWSPTS
jgi:hypothetical protein